MLPVVIVSDFTSPYCWLAEAAMRRLQAEGRVVPEYRALELFPAPAPLPPPPDPAPALALARELGLEIRRPSRSVRTRKAHELALLARAHGTEAAVREAIFRAYFQDDRDVGRIDVLVELARDAGMDVTESKVVLDIDTHAARVLQESAEARVRGIAAVPVLILGMQRVRVDGAYPMDEWRRMVEEAVRSTPTEG